MNKVKKILIGLVCFCVILLSGCGSIVEADGLIEKARKEIPAAYDFLDADKNIIQ